jgi:hypothetical protein
MQANPTGTLRPVIYGQKSVTSFLTFPVSLPQINRTYEQLELQKESDMT